MCMKVCKYCISLVFLLLLVPLTNFDFTSQKSLEEKSKVQSTLWQNSVGDFASFSDWDTAPKYLPYDSGSTAIAANNSVVGIYMGGESAPDGSGNDEPRVSIIRSNQTDFSWFSETYELHDDYSDVSSGVVSAYVIGDGKAIIAVAACNTDSAISENPSISGSSEIACTSEGGIDSEGALVRIFGISIHENLTQDLGSITYSECGRQPSSGGGSSGWNYEYFTPHIKSMAIYGDFSNFSIMIGHKHKNYDGQAGNGNGWPNSDTSKCKINFNGTELDQLDGSNQIALDYLEINGGTGTSTRLASGLSGLEKTSFSSAGTGVWDGSAVSQSSYTRCENFTTGSTVALTNFTTSNTFSQPGVRYLPGQLNNGNGGQLAMMDTVNCTIVETYQTFMSLEANVWTDDQGITKVIATNNGGSSMNQFGYTINRAVTYEASFAPNGSLITVSSTSISSDSSAAYPWVHRGYEGWTSGSTPIYARDIDGDNTIDMKDKFPTDPLEWEDSDLDGFGDNGDACPSIWGNSSFDRNGCQDSDGDTISDLSDSFINDFTQYSDSDSDGFGDNASGNLPDSCPMVYGDSTRGGILGCIDGDGDGWADSSDQFDQDLSQWNDTDGDGYGDSLIGFQGDACPIVSGNSTQDGFGCIDTDGDGWSDNGDDFVSEPTQWSDRDFDGYGDNQSTGANLIDFFPGDSTQWNDSDEDGHGDNPYGTEGDWFPNDPNLWQDSDRDGVADENDAFTNDATQWNDSDGDGYGDNPNGLRVDVFPNDPDEWYDNDGDGYGNNGDAFPSDGTQWNDTDGDGHGDNPFGSEGDMFPNDSTRWQDSDVDGVADEDDAFVNENSQNEDRDGDGFGDNPNGTRADQFPDNSLEWYDTDGDGYGNNGDVFPNDGTQWNDSDEDGHGDNPFGSQGDWFPDNSERWQDSDRDGVADEDDAFPNDPTQSYDSDNDGFGDNQEGTDSDEFPQNSSEWLDTDGDGIGNNADAFPFDPSQQTDTDGDGFGDNERGSGADKFVNDSSQWLDIDGDGYGDNPDGTNFDAFIADPTQWADTDGDGYGDNPTGRQADAFIDDMTQWLDQDGDGFGDNQSGNDPDPYLFDFDNDGYNDSIDPLPKFASPGDLDNDGTLDVEDLFEEDFREWFDFDGDGEGDNADTDDDNDGWADTDEIREGTNPFDDSSMPVEGFNVIVPGTQISLGAWDLIGMFAGIPLFFWVSFGFVTRNRRTAKFEQMLRNAKDRNALEKVAVKWEYSLMMRLLGPHQGIRLERLRSDLDYRYEAKEKEFPSLKPRNIGKPELPTQEIQKVQESTINSVPDKPVERRGGVPDGKGYEWYSDAEGIDWYRNEGSSDEWQRFEA